MINPSDVDIASLPSVSMSDRHSLPVLKGIYFAIDSQGSVQYIGSATGIEGLRQRWKAETHHRYNQLFEMGCSLAYLTIEADAKLIVEIEEALTEWFEPALNGTPVRREECPAAKRRSIIRWNLNELMAKHRIKGKELAVAMNLKQGAVSSLRQSVELPRIDASRLEAILVSLNKLAKPETMTGITKIDVQDLIVWVEDEE